MNLKKTKINRSVPCGAKYYLNGDDRFIIENYNQARPFVNFFPGIAGLWGIPMWVFYVNRGQCLSSFGVESKDKAIMEFYPANKAFRYASFQGFRTFLKIKNGSQTVFYEPFQDTPSNKAFRCTQKMAITAHDLTLEEVNPALGLEVTVHYSTLPEEQYAALIRRVTIKNVSRKTYAFEMVDGMPSIIPYGFNDWLLKHMSHTIEAWIQVANLEKKAPYFNLKMAVNDKPYVENIQEGNFYFAFRGNGERPKLLDVIVQPYWIFGQSKDFVYPMVFLEKKDFRVPSVQKASNKTPCAMCVTKAVLAPGKAMTVTSLTGHIHSCSQLNAIVKKSLSGQYLTVKARRNREIIDEIKNHMFTHSASREFDLYSAQTFIDNVLRGGLPMTLKTQEGQVVFNVFSRKHGDPERDYNYFVVNPTVLSQGNGNYRDVNQNRRNDVWFNQDLKDAGVINMLNLIQADGYNPLVVKGTAFYLKSPRLRETLVKRFIPEADRAWVNGLLSVDFYPGWLLKEIFEKDVRLKATPVKFLIEVLRHCQMREVAEHGEGFWTDHWTYNLDLIESYLGLFPEKLRELLIEKKRFVFYHNHHYVLPRRQRYLLTAQGPRQYHSVAQLPEGPSSDPKLKTRNGKGEVYQTTCLAKLLCLAANKVSTLDPSGIGIEMEADKPNWYDALNGLPGLIGSSLNETLELKRLCVFLLESFDRLGLHDADTVKVFEELSDFTLRLLDILRDEPYPLSYWGKANEAKEKYRLSVLRGVSGAEREMTIAKIKKFLELVIARTDKALKLAKDRRGLIAAYFTHEITHYKKLDKVDGQGFPYIAPRGFKLHALPIFLEGFVHALRVENDKEKARRLYERVRASSLFDRKLGMYRVNADLSKETPQIGRASIFPAGWLENQSIWIHMEYKFLLELLRCGLYKEFYDNARRTLIPFLDPNQYGRSILENSSFIVSSSHENPSIHGRGYVARLSGSTAEFVHLWLWMSAGLEPFALDLEGRLTLSFKPILKGSFFATQPSSVKVLNGEKKWEEVLLPKNTYAFNFLGSTLVVYHNPQRQDTFDNKVRARKIVILWKDSKVKEEILSDVIGAPYAQKVRDNKAKRIDVFLS